HPRQSLSQLSIGGLWENWKGLTSGEWIRTSSPPTPTNCWPKFTIRSLTWTGIRGAPITCQLVRCLVTEYKFRIGQLVYFHPKRTARSQVDAGPGPYQIVRRLPATDDGEFQYEIRSAVEDHNWVARESELTRA